MQPDRWPDLQRVIAVQNGFDEANRVRIDPPKSATGSNGMVVGTSEPFAIRAGMETLKAGGSEADAAVSTALTQVALTSGAAVSYAGILTAVYYDAGSGQVHTLNAGYNTVRNETEPLTIPGPGTVSGRTALVPGFMAGVGALHQRFGRLPFDQLFEPAIWVADRGFPMGPVVAGMLGSPWGERVLRLPEGQRIFLKADGQRYAPGEMLRQPDLARTLRAVAKNGAAYMYTGPWAQHFVDTLTHFGGKMSMQDLAAYKAQWTEPLRVAYRGQEIVTLGAPNRGGFHTLATLKLAEVADLARFGHYAKSPDSLYYLIQFSKIARALTTQPDLHVRAIFQEKDDRRDSVLADETARRWWGRVQAQDWNRKMEALLTRQTAGNNHSAGVLAVDAAGNVACVLHSINTVAWGSGMFVDGVSVPDSAAEQQKSIAEAGRGVRLPDGTNPLLVMKAGRPVLASVAVGIALHAATVQNLMNVLDFHLDPAVSMDQPNSQGPFFGISMTGPLRPEWGTELVGPEFSARIVDAVRARGQRIKVAADDAQRGYWIGLQIQPHGPRFKGAAPKRISASAEAY